MLHWKLLARLSEEQLGSRDIAETNLACAEGLPDAEKINEAECIDRLNHYARCVQHYTERRMPEFCDRPQVYDGSEAIFRIVCMVTLLQRQFGIRYNAVKKSAAAPFNTADTFVHGALMGEGGTCASLPVVYTAVGRRLGYPLKLVECRQHLFVRWDDPGGERFNIEVNDKGTDTPSDDYYRRGQYEISPVAEKEYGYLLSQTPKMELAGFLAQRGHRWLEIAEGRYKEAAESFLWASALVPENKLHAFRAKRTMEAWRKWLNKMKPPHCPQMEVHFPPRRRWPETIPQGVERHFIMFEATQACLMEPRHQGWWEALRRANGERPRNVPQRIDLRVEY